MSEREGVRITFTRRGGAEEFIEVFVPGAVTRTQRVIPPSEGPSPAIRAARARAPDWVRICATVAHGPAKEEKT